MEILEIQSTHSLLTSMPASRPAGAHVYKVHCSKFSSIYRNWKMKPSSQGRALDVMTLGFERIWITGEEAEQVAAAIQSSQSPLMLG